MTTYIYKGASDFFYHDICIAQMGDILDITDIGIRNISNENKFISTPINIISDILNKCEEYNPEIGIDPDTVDFTDYNNSSIKSFVKLNKDPISRLISLGVLKTSEDSCRDYNVGKSNYSEHVIQPWAIWLDYNLNPWDADIVKRILRTKQEPGISEVDSRILDYEKIIHICKERIRQLKN